VRHAPKADAFGNKSRLCWTRLDLLSAMNKHSQAAFAIDTQRTC